MPRRQSTAAVCVKTEFGVVEAPPAKRRRTSVRSKPAVKDEPTQRVVAETVAIKVEVGEIAAAGPSAKRTRKRSSGVKAEPFGEAPAAVKGEGKASAAGSTPASSSKSAVKAESSPSKTPRKRATQSTAPAGSDPSPKRMLRERKTCPLAIQERAARVMSQRMFMIERAPSEEGEEFKVLGSTGNVYTVVIGPFPSCDCPDCRKGNVPCKHIIFVFLKILKVPIDSAVWYQRHILPDELAGVYAAAPAPAAVGKCVSVSQAVRKGYRRAFNLGSDSEEEGDEEVTGTDGIEPGEKRLTAIGDDCPICFEEMTEGDNAGDKLVFDGGIAGCGKPIHKECFAMWAATAKQKREAVTCVYCRHEWARTDKTAAAEAFDTPEGYINLATMAGMSGVRDTSSYYHGPSGAWRPYERWERRYHRY